MSRSDQPPSFPARLHGARVVIAGADGFLGSHAAVAAQRSGATVVGVDRPGPSHRGQRVRESLGGQAINCRRANLIEQEAWSDLIADSRPDAILNLAGTTGRGAGRWRENLQGNLLIVTSLAGALLALPAGRRPVVLQAGSQMEYGAAPSPWREETRPQPNSSYGAAKLAATEMLLALARSDSLRACVARLPIVFGPAQGPTMFVPELILTTLAKRPFRMTEGRQRRRFLFARDGANLLLEMTARLLDGEELPTLINAPAPDPVSIRQVAEELSRLLGGDLRLEVGSLPRRADEADDAWPDDGLGRSLGFEPELSLADGLRDTLKWYRDHPWFREEAGA